MEDYIISFVRTKNARGKTHGFSTRYIKLRGPGVLKEWFPTENDNNRSLHRIVIRQGSWADVLFLREALNEAMSKGYEAGLKWE